MFIKHSETGAILTVVNADKIFSDKYEGFIWVDCVDTDGTQIDSTTHYVLDGELIKRHAQATTLTGLWLTNLPIPSTLYIDGTAYLVDQFTVELDFPLPGTYSLRVEAFPYLDWTAEVTV